MGNDLELVHLFLTGSGSTTLTGSTAGPRVQLLVVRGARADGVRGCGRGGGVEMSHLPKGRAASDDTTKTT